MWELAHDRYADGLFAEEKWLGWNSTLADVITQGPRRLPREVWNAVKMQFGSDFASVVDKAYAEET